MDKGLSKTIHGDFDSVFYEVKQPQKIAWTTEGQLRLFHLNLRNNYYTHKEMKAFLYRNIGEYVFSRARIERFKTDGNAHLVGAQALRVLNKKGVADVKGTGAELEKCFYTLFWRKN